MLLIHVVFQSVDHSNSLIVHSFVLNEPHLNENLDEELKVECFPDEMVTHKNADGLNMFIFETHDALCYFAELSDRYEFKLFAVNRLVIKDVLENEP